MAPKLQLDALMRSAAVNKDLPPLPLPAVKIGLFCHIGGESITVTFSTLTTLFIISISLS